MIVIGALLEGSIPAYAGDPVPRDILTTTVPVYPRLRGGSAVIQSICAAVIGLSPPTRGIRTLYRIAHDYEGSIPAYAGDPR